MAAAEGPPPLPRSPAGAGGRNGPGMRARRAVQSSVISHDKARKKSTVVPNEGAIEHMTVFWELKKIYFYGQTGEFNILLEAYGT